MKFSRPIFDPSEVEINQYQLHSEYIWMGLCPLIYIEDNHMDMCMVSHKHFSMLKMYIFFVRIVAMDGRR